MFRKILLSVALFAASGMSAQAALQSRLSGQAYYDTVLNITWLTDGNLADNNAFGVAGINANGSMTWTKANEWIAAMNTAAYLGISNWRLPTVTDTGPAGCNFGYTGTDCGYNVNLATGELARMFYGTLGNTGAYNTSSTLTGCSPLCLTNVSPFLNLNHGTSVHWSGTTYAPSALSAWGFTFSSGFQGPFDKGELGFAWAVRPGDSPLEAPAVPVPAAAWLFGGALGALGWIRRRQAKA